VPGGAIQLLEAEIAPQDPAEQEARMVSQLQAEESAIMPASKAAAAQVLRRFSAEIDANFAQNMPGVTSKDETQNASWMIRHKVRTGDRFENIVHGYFGTRDPVVVQAIARFAQLDDPNDIKSGHMLYLPNFSHLDRLLANLDYKGRPLLPPARVTPSPD
jgi:hypothetical protein